MPTKQETKPKTDFPVYDGTLAAIYDLRDMQGTAAYKRLIERIHEKVEDAKKRLLLEEKSRPVIHLQESVKVLRWVIDVLQEPVARLEGFLQANPLMAPAEHANVTWDEDTETVVIED